MDGSRDPMSLSDAFSVFFHDDDDTDRWSGSGSGSSIDDFIDENDEENQITAGSSAESKAFWESQQQQLEEELSRSSSIERRIQADVNRIRSSTACRCSDRPAREFCRKCALRELTDRLRDAGYNSAICKCKWRRSLEIPSGEHRFVDVVVDGKGGKGPVRVLIELEFRAEFEMARANGEYNGMVSRLPEVFVGKAEKMKVVVKIMCAAAKRCMKENRMHMAPWRKCRYMQSKWLGPCERSPAAAPAATPVAGAEAAARGWQRKPGASMLTLDLHRTAVEVV